MKNPLMDLLKKARGEAYRAPRANALDEAIALVKTGYLFDTPSGCTLRGEWIDALQPGPCLVIPLPPPEPVATDADRELAQSVVEAVLKRIHGGGWTDVPNYGHAITTAALAIAKKRAELDA